METAIAEEEVQKAMDALEVTTKRGFDLKARLKNRGLRSGSITVYLDEDKGAELGWAYDVTDRIGMFVRRERHGILGELDHIAETRDKAVAAYEEAVKNPEMTAAAKKKAKAELDTLVEAFEARIAELSVQRDEKIVELRQGALTIYARAVPPIIQKDCHRKAKDTLAITGKKIPADIEEEFELAKQAHLMAVMIQSITDHESGGVITEVSYDDAIDFIDQLPPAQFQRLDNKLGEIQFTDNISRTIESQEDFS